MEEKQFMKEKHSMEGKLFVEEKHSGGKKYSMKENDSPEAVRENISVMEPDRENYTVEDIYTLPEGQRAEVFDGRMVPMAFPTTTHQSMIGCLFTEISIYLRAKDERSRVFTSPFAVFLKEDGRNYLEPDIAVVCDEGKLDEEGCHGAPDWVIEVVSSSSRGIDYGKKLGAYIDAGVREYWIVDSEKKVIVAYYLEQPDIPVIHHFGDIVKPGIYQDLMIDSSQLERIQYRRASVRTRDKEDAFSSLVSAVKRALTAEHSHVEVNASLVESVVRNELQTVKEQLEKCPDDREDLKAEYKKRYDVIAEYAPEIMTSSEEVRAYIESHFGELAASKNKGQMMKAAMGVLKGRADSKIINEAVGELCK